MSEAEEPAPPPPLAIGNEIRTLPVVSALTGEDVAEIRDIVYDPEAGRVVGFTLNKRGMLAGRMREVLVTDRVHAIGRDAVMVADEAQLQDPADVPKEIGSTEAERNVLGNDVLTESGSSLGIVADVVVLAVPGPEGRAGQVVGYEIKLAAGGQRYIPLPAQLAVSGAALVVPDATEQYVVEDITQLAAVVDRYRAQVRGDE